MNQEHLPVYASAMKTAYMLDQDPSGTREGKFTFEVDDCFYAVSGFMSR